MSTFSDRLTEWVKSQPEYTRLLFGSRPERRRLARVVAKAVTTIPRVEHAMPVLVPKPDGTVETVYMNRATRRRVGVEKI